MLSHVPVYVNVKFSFLRHNFIRVVCFICQQVTFVSLLCIGNKLLTHNIRNEIQIRITKFSGVLHSLSDGHMGQGLGAFVLRKSPCELFGNNVFSQGDLVVSHFVANIREVGIESINNVFSRLIRQNQV